MPKSKKKYKPFMKKRFKRAVKQRATLIERSDLLTIQELTERVRNARNYMYSRLAGVNSYLLLQDAKKQIRDVWVKDKQLVKQFRLPARFWKITLEEVVLY